jgi:hypothetical protein
MLRLVLRTSPYMEARARFVLEALCTQYRIPLTEQADNATFTLYYGDPSQATDDVLGHDGGIIIPLQANTEAFFREHRRFDPASAVEWGSLRYLFGTSGTVEQRGRWSVLPVDLIASAFFFLSAYQEWVSDDADEQGRFPAKELLQVQWGIEQIPLVDRYFAALIPLLPVNLNITLAPFIGHAPFMVALSHDIDYLYRGHGSTPIIQALQVAAWARSWLTGKATFEKVFTTLRGFTQYPYFNLDQIARQEVEAGVRATYYFLPHYGVPKRHLQLQAGTSDWRYDDFQLLTKRYPGVDADYHLEDARVMRALHGLEAQGMEIGLHSGYYSVMDGLLAEDVARLRQFSTTAQGMRAHYLRFRVQSLYQQLNSLAKHEALPLEYDHSMGIPGSAGYRTGTAYPHRLFDHDSGQPFETLSIPLHFMETWYMPGFKPAEEVEGAWDVLLSMLEATRQSAGILTVLTHNWLFSESGVVLYTRLLDYLRQHAGRGIAVKDIAGWWKRRQVQDGA